MIRLYIYAKLLSEVDYPFGLQTGYPSSGDDSIDKVVNL
jgi:hypothetical protein